MKLIKITAVWCLSCILMNDRNNEELDFNKKNREDFENLMDKSSVNKDGYWDKNNPVVKIVLGLMGLVILAGASYYIVTYILNH